MAESTLTLAYDNFMTEVGRLLDYLSQGEDQDDLSTAEEAECDRLVQSGVRQFYVPPPLTKNGVRHTWSFLAPATTLLLAADDWDYDLPDNFGSLVGHFNIQSTTIRHPPIPLRGEGEVRHLHQGSGLTGRPLMAAIRPKAFVATTGQRFEVLFYPMPDSAYTLDYRFNVLTNKLTTANKYPLGGMLHSETILASCLAVAEKRVNNEAGVHHDEFMRLLAASIQADANMVPETLGYNADPSTALEGQRILYNNYSTVNGVIPT